MNEIRHYINLVESHSTVDEGGLGSPSSFVLADPVQDLHEIVSALKQLTEVFGADSISSTAREELISGLHNLRNQALELVESVHENMNEELGTEEMAPSTDSTGERDYSDPKGSSYSAKIGLVG